MNYQSGPSHLGDTAWCLLALRRIPGPHTFFTPVEYHPQLIDLCENRRIELAPLEQAPPDARCTWIGCGRFESQWLRWSNQVDIVGFLMQWSNLLCIENGIEPQFVNRQDMLADWPAICRHSEAPEFDALVINAQPMSGQIPRYSNSEMNSLIEELTTRHRVLVTNETTAKDAMQFSGTISQIGNLSLRAKFIIANATGPMWGIHNVWSQGIAKYIMCDPYLLDYGQPMPHHGLVALGLRQNLIADNWL